MALTAQQRKFKTAAKSVNQKCHRETSSFNAWKSCMSSGMKAALRTPGGRRKKKAAAKTYKPCQYKSGENKGKLKKGWRYGKNGRCVKAKG